jgi:hypothetical protein
LTDPFLEIDRVRTEERACRVSINAAVQRNRTYRHGTPSWARVPFRERWMVLMAIASNRYRASVDPVLDDEHRRIISSISESMTREFESLLHGGRLRYGTAAKAFDLYVKYLWRLGVVKTAPKHCPIDGIVLAAVRISGSWTQCDDESVHSGWNDIIQASAGTQGAAIWEYDLWLRVARQLRNSAKAKAKTNTRCNSMCDAESLRCCHEGFQLPIHTSRQSS